MNKKILVVILIVSLIVLPLQVKSYSQDQELNYANFIELSNKIAKIEIDNKELKGKTIQFDNISFHIYIYILFGFLDVSDSLDEIFNSFYIENKDDIELIRKDFFNFYFNEKSKGNIYDKTDFIEKYFYEKDLETKKDILINILNIMLDDSMFKSDINTLVIKDNGSLYSAVMKYLIINHKIFEDIKNKSKIYENLINYWKNFVVIYHLEDDLKKLYDFYSLKLKKVKVQFIFYGSNPIDKEKSSNNLVNQIGGYYENGEITLINCFNNDNILIKIFFHELIHFNDIYSKGYEYGNMEVDIRDLFNSVHLEAQNQVTDKEEIKKIKNFLLKYMEYNGVSFELYSELGLYYFLLNVEGYEEILKKFLDNYHIKYIGKEHITLNIDNNTINFFKKVEKKEVISTMFIELLNYLIQKDSEINFRNFIFQEDKENRDIIMKNIIIDFIQNKIPEICSKDKWVLEETIKIQMLKKKSQK